MEKKPTQSKKWIASMTWSLLWFLLILFALYYKTETSVLTSMIYGLSMVQGLYLGGQAAVDTFLNKKLGSKSENDETKFITG